MARRKRVVELDDIQTWISQGVSLLPNIHRTYSFLLATLVYSGKACYVPIEKMERFSDELRTNRNIS